MDTLDAAAFDDIFQGMTVTLMASRPLRRELALLRAALPPVARADWPQRPLSAADVVAVTTWLQPLLPAVPDAPASLRPTLGLLTGRQSAQARLALLAAYQAIRAHPGREPLWLVPTVWPLRMVMLLEGQMFPADVRVWQSWRAPGPQQGPEAVA